MSSRNPLFWREYTQFSGEALHILVRMLEKEYYTQYFIRGTDINSEQYRGILGSLHGLIYNRVSIPMQGVRVDDTPIENSKTFANLLDWALVFDDHPSYVGKLYLWMYGLGSWDSVVREYNDCIGVTFKPKGREDWHNNLPDIATPKGGVK